MSPLADPVIAALISVATAVACGLFLGIVSRLTK